MNAVQIVPYEPRFRRGMLVVARAIHAHSIYADFIFDEAKLVAHFEIAGSLKDPDRYFRLAVRDEEVLGGFYGCKLRVFFSGETIVKDMGWWVRPEARGQGAASALLADFEQWGRHAGARWAMIAQNGVEDIETTSRLFQYHGYRFTGYNTAKEL